MGIKVENLTKSYDGKIVIENLTMEFPDAGITVLMAPSGFGKTTLLRLIAGLEKPDKGKITGAKRISFVFQESLLFPWLTALENITEIAGVKREEAIKLLEMMDMEDSMHLYPDQLSGGMQRRVALARALARGGTLLLDEPFNGLDEELKNQINEMIVGYGKNNTVIMVTHNTEEAEKSGGRVVNLGQ